MRKKRIKTISEEEEMKKMKKKYKDICEKKKEEWRKEKEKELDDIKSEAQAWEFIRKGKQRKAGISSEIKLNEWINHFMETFGGEKKNG